MSKKSSTSGNLLKGFRYGIKFSERFFRNTLSQARWIFDQIRWAYTGLSNLYFRKFGTQPNWVMKISTGMILTILGLFLFFALLFWALLKSI